MKKLILILLTTTITAFAGFSGPGESYKDLPEEQVIAKTTPTEIEPTPIPNPRI